MKIDFRKIAILFLLISSTGFGLTWYLGGYDTSKQKVKQLEEEYKKLKEEKEAADAKVAAWKEIYDKKDAQDKKLAIEVGTAKAAAMIAKESAAKAKEDLSKLQGGIEQTRREIEELQSNPKELTDDELLEELIKNTSSVENKKVNKVSEIKDNEIEIKHIVKIGETLYSLSKLYNVSVSEILEQNDFLTNKGLQVGQTLTIKKN
jgi:LysM repeat protein